MKTMKNYAMGLTEAAAAFIQNHILGPQHRSEKALRVLNHRRGPGRRTLYTLHKGIERSRTPQPQSRAYILRQAKRRRRMALRAEAHLPFTAEGQAALRMQRQERR